MLVGVLCGLGVGVCVALCVGLLVAVGGGLVGCDFCWW